MNTNTPNVIYRKVYTPHDFEIKEIKIHIELISDATIVTATSSVTRHPKGTGGADLILNGTHQEIQSIKIDGHLISDNDFEVTEEFLTIKIL